MKTNVMTTQLQRRRKFLLVMPALVLPFLTILFWSMKANDDPSALAKPSVPGLNTHLPGARLKDSGMIDKLSFYQQADQASRKLTRERQQDPYARFEQDSSSGLSELAFQGKGRFAGPGLLERTASADDNEQKIYERLNKLQKSLDREPSTPSVPKTLTKSRPQHFSETNVPVHEDPELRQMNNIIEKLVQLQQPQTAKPTPSAANTITRRFRAVAAVIDGKQRITDNTVVRMRLTDTATIGGQLFGKGQLIYAAGMFSNQRMKIDVRSIHIGNVIYPVDLTVFDAEDGLEGISVPKAITGDALRGGAASGVQSMELMSLDPSISAQLATAGVNTAKGLFGKKVKRIKARIQDRRPLLLRVNQPVVSAAQALTP
jgi:hypothetical protein